MCCLKSGTAHSFHVNLSYKCAKSQLGYEAVYFHFFALRLAECGVNSKETGCVPLRE
jgi:hypothetical protein